LRVISGISEPGRYDQGAAGFTSTISPTTVELVGDVNRPVSGSLVPGFVSVNVTLPTAGVSYVAKCRGVFGGETLGGTYV